MKKIIRLPRFRRKCCPLCGALERDRTGRPRNWRLMPLGRSYSCRRCHSHYIEVFLGISLLVEAGFVPFYIPESTLDTSLYVAAGPKKKSGVSHTKHIEVKKKANRLLTKPA